MADQVIVRRGRYSCGADAEGVRVSLNPLDRTYLQTRVREEIDRHRRYGHEFSLVMIEAHPVADGLPLGRKIDLAVVELRRHLRPSNVVMRAFEDTMVVLLVETGAVGARDALLRVRHRLLSTDRGGWTIALLVYPRDARSIDESPLMQAA